MMTRRHALALLAVAPVLAQRRSQQQRAPQQRGPEKQGDDVLLRFPGTLRAISKKEILLEVENEQELVFRRLKKTRFIDSGKEVKPETAPTGQPIVVEGRRALNGDLEAVRVLWNEKPADSPPS